MIKTDVEAWNAYPFHRNWFNKLWVSQQLGYCCGPNGIPVPREGLYVVRPIMNLYGMSAGATKMYLTPDEPDSVPPGYFWCENFEGEQLSVELSWSPVEYEWSQTSVWKAHRSDGSLLYNFSKWERIQKQVIIPTILNRLWDCGNINIETIGGNVIEVHLRCTPDPVEYDELVPVWNFDEADKHQLYSRTHQFVESADFVFGTSVKRLGFYCK
jgi:hypothetical protein